VIKNHVMKTYGDVRRPTYLHTLNRWRHGETQSRYACGCEDKNLNCFRTWYPGSPVIRYITSNTPDMEPLFCHQLAHYLQYLLSEAGY